MSVILKIEPSNNDVIIINERNEVTINKFIKCTLILAEIHKFVT